MINDEANRNFSRREAIAAGAAAVVAATLPAAAAAQATAPPNIIFILADDLGFADLSCYGRRDYRTERLDRLASEGLLMTQAYSNSSVCSPTRVGLFTGRYQGRLRVGLEEPIVRAGEGIGIPPGHPTLASLFKARGYRTALVGKWHMGWPPRFGPLRYGYDRFFGIIPGASDYFHHGGDGDAVPADTSLREGDEPIVRQGYLTDLLANRAVEEIRAAAQASTPLMLSLHFTAPHWPWEGPEDEAASASLRSLFHHDGGSLEIYARMMQSLDAGVGRVLDAVAETGGALNTIVVFTSDNGGERFSDTWPLRGAKTELLEGGIRVPQIVRWPRRIVAGGRSDQVMISMDWLPTLLAAAGGRPPSRFPSDGEDLLAVLTGASPPRSRELFWRFKAGNQAAVRSGNLKYLRRGDREALYDLAADPRERANLAERRPDDLRRLREAHERWAGTMLPYPEESFSSGRMAD
jgi:arylsulfatase A-like enzyme